MPGVLCILTGADTKATGFTSPAPLANYPNQVMVGNFIFYDAASGWITVDLDGSGDAYGEAALIRLQAEGSTGLPIALSDADFLIVGSTPGPVL